MRRCGSPSGITRRADGPRRRGSIARSWPSVPDHADALHLLGVLAFQTGHIGAAIDLIGRAIAINPAVAEYHSNLGES